MEDFELLRECERKKKPENYNYKKTRVKNIDFISVQFPKYHLIFTDGTHKVCSCPFLRSISLMMGTRQWESYVYVRNVWEKNKRSTILS